MAELEAEEPTAWTLREVKVNYHRPARLDDALDVQHPSDRPHRRALARVAAHLCRRNPAGGWPDRSLHHHVNGQAAPPAREVARSVDAFSFRNRYLKVIPSVAPYFGQD